MLLPGARTPRLDLPTLDGRFDLHAQDGWDLVMFQRGLHCTQCKEQCQDLCVHLDTLAELGVRATVVTMEDDARTRRMQEEWNIGRLRFAHSMNADAAHAWGLVISNGRGDEPARFNEPGMALVRPDGTLQGHWMQSLPYAVPKIADVVAGIRSIQEHDVPPRAEAERLEVGEVESRH